LRLRDSRFSIPDRSGHLFRHTRRLPRAPVIVVLCDNDQIHYARVAAAAN